ncbi:MAG: DUF2313 domain-containing protein [Lachnospiraceae bacterium]|nr:DUF2313 domain-containing protein [Lachnospiraceae bacterium]
MKRNLIDFLPDIFKTFEEFKEIMRVEQKQISELWEIIYGIINEALVDEATGEGLKRWENILNITVFDTDDVKVRRLRIQAKIIEDVPYTERVLNNILTGLCGENGFMSALNNEEYTLTIKVALTSKNLKDEVVAMCERIVPANIVLDIDLMYNTHGILRGYTHKQLRQFTHGQLRNEVLP